MPMYYGATPLKLIMQQGSGLAEVWPWLAALVGCIIVLYMVNTLSLKKYRKL